MKKEGGMRREEEIFKNTKEITKEKILTQLQKHITEVSSKLNFYCNLSSIAGPWERLQKYNFLKCLSASNKFVDLDAFLNLLSLSGYG